jgi:fatty-acyl-CoA synthase
LNYTSGTTGNPKGVVYHHRGAAINAVSNILDWDINKHPTYLWTLPMFHCNGWCFPWTIAARAGINVCLRRVDAEHIFAAIKEHAVTHYCAAPIVHNLLVNAPDELKEGVPTGVKGLIAGAAPPASIIEGMEKLGFDLTHVYGLTEVYGPAAVCVKQDEWNEVDIGERARLNARQGVRYHMQQAIAVLDPETLKPVPADGETMGEIMFKGNIAMKGYLKNEKATKEAFEGGWFHSGDLAVMNPDGYVKMKDRSKDIIISGGENISSVEVEDVLYRHPAVIAAAVVAKPDPKWGETPCAFLEIKPGIEVTPADIIAHCKQHLAGFKVPRAIVFCELPKTSTGKIQKFELRKQAGSASAIDV